MTLRITLEPVGEAETVLRLEGRFSSADSPVFESCLEGVDGAALRLDLAEIRWLDPAAVDRLRELIRQGARIVATSPFVERLLARDGRDSPPPHDSTKHG